MARPRKNNADYFSHDNDMRNDDKILSVRRKFWHEWYSIWNMILEKLCKSNWFIIDVDNVSIELLSWDFVVEPEKLKEIIDYFVYIRLISREWDRIYSQKMIDRFEWLLSKRQRDIEYRQWKHKEEIVIDVEKPQSKVKESKVKEIKEDYLYINNIYKSDQDIKNRIYELYDKDIVWNNISKYKLLVLFATKWYDKIKDDIQWCEKFFTDMIDKSHRYWYSAQWFADWDTLLLKAKEMYEWAEWWNREIKNHMSTLNKFLAPNPKK